MNKFLNSAGISAALLVGATVSAQAQSAPAAAPAAPAAPAARFAFTAHDTSTSKAVEFSLNRYADLTVEGYLAAGASFEKNDHKRLNGNSGRVYSLFNSQRANQDAAFVGFKLTNKQTNLSAYTSILWVPNGKGSDGFDEAGILDAYVSWEKATNRGKITVTGGKYLSYYGLESFYAPAMTQISYGLQSFLPGYHTGVKLDYVSSDEKLALGISAEDSLFSGNGFNQGDGRLGGVGIEGFLSYQFSPEFKFSAIVGGDTRPDTTDAAFYAGRPDFDFCSNLIATYTKELRSGGSIALSGELNYMNRASQDTAVKNNETTGWALVAHYSQNSKRAVGFSALARLSAAYYTYAPDDAAAYQLTLSPGYAFNKHFLIRAEFSWTHRNNGAAALTDYPHSNNVYFFGVQSILTF